MVMLVVETLEIQETLVPQEMVVDLATVAEVDKKVGLLAINIADTLAIILTMAIITATMVAILAIVLSAAVVQVVAVVLVVTQEVTNLPVMVAPDIAMEVMEELHLMVQEAAAVVVLLQQEILEDQETQVLLELQTQAELALQQHLALHQTFQQHHKRVIPSPSLQADL